MGTRLHRVFCREKPPILQQPCKQEKVKEHSLEIVCSANISPAPPTDLRLIHAVVLWKTSSMFAVGYLQSSGG
jgi:hypothetical protein